MRLNSTQPNSEVTSVCLEGALLEALRIQNERDLR